MTGHPLWLRGFWKIHQAMDEFSGGRLGTRVGRIPVLWLTTTGRKSGALRTNGLYYLQDGQDFVVVASNVGLEVDPSWWLNLQAHPETTARTGRDDHLIRARRATPEERARLWPRLVELNPDYAAYQERTRREIPVVVLEPRVGG